MWRNRRHTDESWHPLKSPGRTAPTSAPTHTAHTHSSSALGSMTTMADTAHGAAPWGTDR